MTIHEQIEEALNKLDSQDDIAAFFAAEGIKGDPYSIYDCPVAKYLTREVGVPCWAFTQAGVTDDDVECRRIPVPSNVVDFALAFDKEWYPELIV